MNRAWFWVTGLLKFAAFLTSEADAMRKLRWVKNHSGSLPQGKRNWGLLLDFWASTVSLLMETELLSPHAKHHKRARLNVLKAAKIIFFSLRPSLTLSPRLMKWHNHGSQQPPTSGLEWSFYLSLPKFWEHSRHELLHLAPQLTLHLIIPNKFVLKFLCTQMEILKAEDKVYKSKPKYTKVLCKDNSG